MQRELAHLLAQETQPYADGREREAGDRKQKTCADREIVGIVILRTAAGDEAVGATEGRGEDDERANRNDYPGMTPRKAAQMQFDPDHPPHYRFTQGSLASLSWRRRCRAPPCEVLEDPESFRLGCEHGYQEVKVRETPLDRLRAKRFELKFL